MDFADILDNLGRPAGTGEAPPKGDDAARADFRRVLDGLAQDGGNAGIDDEARSRAAYRAASEAATTPGQPTPDRPAPSVDPSDIAFELELDAAASLADLKISRRLFARANHPDRVPAAERERANRRMAVANALIDAAAARFRN